MRVLNFLLCSIVVFFSFCTELYAASAAYNNDISDARSLGNANAVIARADSPATNWFNPAGLTKVSGTQVSFTSMLETVKTDLTTTAGNKIYAESDYFVIPSLFYSHNFESNFALGLGLNSPYGLATEWGSSVTDYVTTNASFNSMHFNPNLAYAFNDKCSVAIGADVMYAKGDLNKQLNQTVLNYALLLQSTGVSSMVPYADGRSQLQGSDTGIGGNFAFLYTANDKVQIGLNYRTSIDLNLQGKLNLRDLNGLTAAIMGGSEYEVESAIKLPIPETIGFGVAVKPIESTTIELDFEWARWSEVDKFLVKYRDETNPARLAILNLGNPIEKDWKDTFNISLGVEHKINKKYTIYGGTRYRPSPIPEKSFDPIIPSLDLYDLDAGLAVNFGQSTINFSIAYIYGKKRTVNNTVGNSSGTSVSGKYNMKAYVAGLTYTYRY